MPVSRPTLSDHETRLALLERGAQHDAEHDETVLKALKEIRDEIKALNEKSEARMKALEDKQADMDTRLKIAAGTVRGVGIGWAAAFTFLGGAIATAVSNFMGLFK